MKTPSILLGAILMAMAIPAFAQSTSAMQGMQMDQSRSGMKMHQNMPCMKMGKEMPMDGMPLGKDMQGMRMGKNMSCTQQTAQATGVVEGVDTARGIVTIKHQAIAPIHWPAMTMTFRVDPASLLQTVKVGE